ncbi:BRCA2, oligonucleotide/oligosaccharide-binding, domain 1-domain-containing protein [Scleroderma citrinum]
MRLSSPTYDDQVESLSQDHISAFDAFLSQHTLPSFHENRIQIQGNTKTHSPSVHTESNNKHCASDEENPFSFKVGAVSKGSINCPQTTSAGPSFMKASSLAHVPVPEANDPNDQGDLANDPPPDADYSPWFESSASTAFVGFKTAATALQSKNSETAIESRPSDGLLIPSASAFLKAKQKMRLWNDEDEETTAASQEHNTRESTPPPSTRAMSPPRAAFTTASRAFSTPVPETPVPTTRGRAVPPQFLGGKQPKPFKSPLITNSRNSPLQQSTIINISSPLRSVDQPLVLPSPLLPTPTPSFPISQRPLGFTPVNTRSSAKPRFVTPFKDGIGPRVYNSTALKTPTPLRYNTVNTVYPPSTVRNTHEDKPMTKVSIAQVTRRQSLASSTLTPQSFSTEELEGLGINVKELSEINPRTATSYSFCAEAPVTHETRDSVRVLDYVAALDELQARGCTLATKPWVQNHWALVLWKLAGLVALDPKSESDPNRKRWCWSEVIRQLLYRYERDLNGSSRPPLRLIVTRDASVESPMVLCISDIIWPANSVDDNGQPATSHPELEVTDGWYRLRARVDGPLGRATRKGLIKIGRKIAIAGSKLSSPRKEGSEVFEAYDSTVLMLSGNSSHMAPWHAKLGFQKEPFIATLNSLTPDGGNVVVMAVEIVKAYPVAFLEFVEDEDGQKRREGPRNEKEEAKLHLQWKTRRESEAAKLWDAYDKHWSALSSYAEQLEERARSKLAKHEDPPDNIDDLYDALKEDPATAKRVMASINSQDAVWLAQHIQNKTLQEREEAEREIERELEAICPRRDVRDFCVLSIKDAYTSLHPPHRMAQLTVWDAASLTSGEALMKGFDKGQRYLVRSTSCHGYRI